MNPATTLLDAIAKLRDCEHGNLFAAVPNGGEKAGWVCIHCGSRTMDTQGLHGWIRPALVLELLMQREKLRPLEKAAAESGDLGAKLTAKIAAIENMAAALESSGDVETARLGREVADALRILLLPVKR